MYTGQKEWRHKGHYRVLLKPGVSGSPAHRAGARVTGAIKGTGEVVRVRDGEVGRVIGHIEMKCGGKSFILGQENIESIMSGGTTLWRNLGENEFPEQVPGCGCQSTEINCSKEACCSV